ncbi:MAG: lamin tail domain-containing protein [Parcubacteria group bacterium]|nr:lamin tail domain-containing protein [Parcubacteria group bacterium]
MTVSICILALTPIIASAQVVFSEVAWMGTRGEQSDEWIEIFNTGNDPVDLAGWTITENVSVDIVALSGVIKPGQVFVLERSDEKTIFDRVSEIPPSPWKGYGLGNTGEDLTLRDARKMIQDSIAGRSGWPAGAKAEYRTMERTKISASPGPDEWTTYSGQGSSYHDVGGNVILGTPGVSQVRNVSMQSPQFTPNSTSPQPSTPQSQPLVTPQKSPSPSSSPHRERQLQPSAQSTPPLAPSPISHAPSSPPPALDPSLSTASPVALPISLAFSEILPDPTGADATGEWIELTNSADVPLPLKGIHLNSPKQRGYAFSENDVIPPHAFYVLPRTRSHLVLRNEGDTLTLVTESGMTLDTLSYSKSIPGTSYARSEKNRWSWSTTPTPGKRNVIASGDRASQSTTSVSQSRENGVEDVLEDEASQESAAPPLSSAPEPSYSPPPLSAAASGVGSVREWLVAFLVGMGGAVAAVWLRARLRRHAP